MQKIIRLAAPAVLLLATVPARATLIDFTASNDTVYVVDGVRVDVLANGPLTRFGFDGDNALAPCSTGVLACDNDGVGVGDDEISYLSEFVILAFDSAVNVTAIHLFDLFGVNDDGFGNPAEIAKIQFFDASFVTLDLWSMTGNVAPGTASGYRNQAGLVGGVRSIAFYADEGRNSDFSVAGIEFVAVPEPSALALIGAGLIGFGAVARRRRLA